MFTRIDIFKNLNINKVECLVFNKIIIPFTLVGYELMIVDSILCTHCPLSESSYPTRVRGIIVDYLETRLAPGLSKI